MFAAVLDAQFAQLFGFSDLRGMGIAKYRASLLKQFDYSAYAVPLWRTQIVPPFKELIRDDDLDCHRSIIPSEDYSVKGIIDSDE
jgi:hypothetical protein